MNKLQTLAAKLGPREPLSVDDIALAICDNANGNGVSWAAAEALIAEVVASRIAAQRPIADIAAERRRQIEVEGWTPDHDDEHVRSELAIAAALYASPAPLFVVDVRQPFGESAGYSISSPGIVSWRDPWPFKTRQHVRHDLDVEVRDGDKRGKSNRRRELVKAAALIVAEIERLDRIAAQRSEQP